MKKGRMLATVMKVLSHSGKAIDVPGPFIMPYGQGYCLRGRGGDGEKRD